MRPVIVYGNVTVPEFPEAVPVHPTIPVPDPVISIEPFAVAHAEGLLNAPREITGAGLTVTTVGTDVEEHPFPSV